MRPWRWLYTIPLRLRTLFRGARLEQELDEEFRYHLDCRIEREIARGLSPDEARRIAVRSMDGITQHKEKSRDTRGLQWIGQIAQDIRYGVRMLRKNPQFSMAAVGILTLAIGANAALFTLFSNYVLRPLPIRGYDRHFDVTGFDSKSGSLGAWTSAEMRAFQRNADAEVEGLYASNTIQMLLLQPVQRQVLATSVYGDYFGILGGVAMMGRTFGEWEERAPLAVLSHTGWHRLMAGDPAAVGRTLRIASTMYTVVGVMRPEFTGTEMVVPDLWLPGGMRAMTQELAEGSARFHVSGLLRPGVAATRAGAAMTAAAARFERPGEDPVVRIEVTHRPSFLPKGGENAVVFGLVFAAFFTVLLIACANMANLYLSRAAARTQEIAMRISLGASRWRVVRQLLVESTMTALLGAAGGLALAALGINRLQNYIFSTLSSLGISTLPASLDWRVFCYAGVLGIVAGIGFGLLPAIEVTSPGLTVFRKREASWFGGRIRPRRMRNILIGGQTAASLVLLILAGTLVRHIQRMDAIDPGYDLDRIMDVRVDRSPERELMDRLAQEPLVASVTGVGAVPLYGQLGRQAAVANGSTVFLADHRVDDRYFDTLQMPLLQGRGFTRAETESHARTAVISLATARKLWPAGAIGQTLEMADAGRFEVVGVVPDVVSGWFFEGTDASAVYLPASAGTRGIGSVMVRVAGNTAAVRESLRKACVDAGAGCEPQSLREVASMQRFPFQAAAAIASLLGALALLLTAIGLYGVVNYSVVQRRREIGVHAALGATPGRIVRRILGEAWACVLGGMLVGLPICLALSKVVASSVLQIRMLSPMAYVAVAVGLGGIALLSCAGPARRAARMDPVRSLREE